MRIRREALDASFSRERMSSTFALSHGFFISAVFFGELDVRVAEKFR